MADVGAPIGDQRDDAALRRAPYAVAAGLAVFVAGAAFLAFTSSRPGVPANEPPATVETAEAKIATSPEPNTSIIKVDPAGAPPLAPTEIASLAADPSQIPPRLAPNRPADPPTNGFAPRLKPISIAASPAATGAADTVVSLATAWAADGSDMPPPIYFTDEIHPVASSASAIATTDGDIESEPREARVTLAKGETFVDALRRGGVRAEDRNEAALAFGELFNMRRLRPGQEFAMTVVEPNMTFFQRISLTEPPPLYLLSLDFKADPETRIVLTRSLDGEYDAKQIKTPLTTRIAAAQGRILGSLYESAKRQGAPDEVIAGLAQMFAYDIDFQRDVFGGDEFEAIFEIKYDESGRMVAGGDILYGRLKWRNRTKEKGYYRFETTDGAGKADYFDASGESARRLLMKTPIDGARLSSGFGTRKHPILGYQKAHKGVDFAASRGTPIMAAGDGVVERAGPYGSFGNYVRIRHAQGYKTAYAHMNGIKKGVRTGARVRQGDIIGYVGSTGRSTGPHLHYEVHLKDKAVNPQSLKIATGYELGGKELQRFREVRDRVDALRALAVDADRGLVAKSDDGRQL